MTKRNYYTNEFKREAIRLLESDDKSASQVARELGVQRNQLYKWQAEVQTKGSKAFTGPGRKKSSDDELAKLQRENERLQEENDILKKAAAYFARNMK